MPEDFSSYGTLVAEDEKPDFSSFGSPVAPDESLDLGAREPWEMAEEDFTQTVKAQEKAANEPIVPASALKTLMDYTPNAYSFSKFLPLPDSLRQGLEGYKDTLAEGVAGMTSPNMLASAPVFAVPYLGPALAMGMGSKAIGEGAGKTVAAIEAGNPRQIGEGLGEVGFGAAMVVPGAKQAFKKPAPVIDVESTVTPEPPKIPEAPPIVSEAIKVGEEIGLAKSVEALKATESGELPKPFTETQTPVKPVETPAEVREVGVAQVPKEPWQMTRSEFEEWHRVPKNQDSLPAFYAHSDPRTIRWTDAERTQRDREGVINLALKRGYPIPPEILAEYKSGSRNPETKTPELPSESGRVVEPSIIPAEAQPRSAETISAEAPKQAERIYRQMGEDVIGYLPGTKRTSNLPEDLFVSDRPELALGQGSNAGGYLLEMSREGLNVLKSEPPNSPKSAARDVFGGGEYKASGKAQDFANALQAVEVPKALIPAPDANPVLNRGAAIWKRLNDLVEKGEFKKTETETGVRFERQSPPSEPPKPPKVSESSPAIPPDELMRKSAARATESPMIPEPVQETIKTAPESFYKQQSTAKVEDAVKSMSDAELGAVPSDSNLYVASRLEQADRLFKAGNNEAGYSVFVELEKQGTSFGQNINQFKRLAGTMPEYIPRIVDQKLKKAGKDPLKPKQAEVITELARDSKARDKALDDATYEWQKNPTPENAKKAELALDTAEKSALKLQSQVNRFTPRTTANVLKSVLQGNLLTPISEVANVFGNMSFSPFRAADRTIAAGIDAIDSFIRNKPREITVQPIRGTLETAKGAARGLAKVPEILAKGTGDTIKGESRAGLHPIRAWVDQFAKNPDRPTVGGKLGLAERLNMAIEGTFGVPAEAMLRGLGAGDAPFREAAKARITSTYLKLAKVPKEQWAFAQKFPELFLDPITREKIRTETMEAIFQRDSKTLNIFTHWLRGKGDWFDLAVATVAPYKLTPWNIIAEILSYNPLVATAKTVRDAATGNGKGAKLNAGKFAVGSMLTATGYWLYSKGLLAPSLDERDEAQKARVLAGEVLPPNHLNISGLKRALEGGDPALKPGDETVDVMRAGGLAGSVLYMTANIGREFEKKPAVGDSDLWLAILRQSTLEQARFGLNQSFLSGVEGMLTAIKDGNTENYVRQWANTVSSIPLPNTLATVSRATREYKPDLKADTFAKQMENIARNKLGFTGLDDYLPLKRDLWGKPMLETPKDRNALLYQFFDISKNRQVTDDAVPLELYRLWRKTGDTKVIPSIPEKTLTVGKQNYVLTPEQQSRFVELVGEARRNIVDAVVINPNFHNLPDEAKVNLLDKIYREGLQAGKVKLWQEMQGQLAPKPNRAGFNPE